MTATKSKRSTKAKASELVATMSSGTPVITEAALVDMDDLELSEEEAQAFDAKIQQADREIDETRVNFRWGSEQVAVVKRAAALAGVPYQTWMKTVLFEQAISNINRAKSAGITQV